MHFVTASKYLSIQKKMATFLYQDNIVTFRNIAGKKGITQGVLWHHLTSCASC